MLKPSVLALLAVSLLPSCRSVQPPLQAMFHPLRQVQHGLGDAASSYYRLGRYHQQRGELDQALAAYHYAIARDPRGALPRMAAAVIHAQQGRLAQARAMLLAVCADHPDLVQPLNNLGYVYYLQGDYAAAASTFRAALALQPANERALSNLRLAETSGLGGSAGTPALAAGPAEPASRPAPSSGQAPAVSPAAPPEAGAMRLVQVAANVYALRQAPAAAVPRQGPRTHESAARLEISNGNGAAGLAKRFRDALAARGLKASRLTNARPFGQSRTRIEFRPGFESEAQALQRALGGKGILAQAARMAPATDLRLLLGMDAALLPQPAAAAAEAARLLTADINNYSKTQERP